MPTAHDFFRINLLWHQSVNPGFKASNIDYSASISFDQRENEDMGSHLTFKIKLKRKFGRDILETIGPAGLLVIVSWVNIQWETR